MASQVIRVQVVTADLGACPMCGYDSLRRVQGLHLTPNGVGTLFDQTGCGRCINDLMESLQTVGDT